MGWGGTIVMAFLLTPWLIGIKHAKHIILCDTNTVFEHTHPRTINLAFLNLIVSACKKSVIYILETI